MQPSDPPDADLVKRTRAGEDEAFSQLYDRYRDPITSFLTRLVGDGHLAEDLAQEAFVSALRNLSSLREADRFRPWLFTIAHRGALDHIRRGGPVLLAEMPEVVASGESPQDAADAHEAAKLVWDAAASLEPRQLAILELTVRDEVSTAELAHALDVQTSHAAVLAHRARSALGHAVRMLLLARNPRRCKRLAGLVPDRPKTLSRAQRASVDRHLRRCPDCRDLAGRLTAPLGVLAVLLTAATRATTPRADNAAWALVDPSRHLVRKTAVTLGLTLALTVLWSLIPHNSIPPETARPTPTVSTTTEIPAVTTTAATPSTVAPTSVSLQPRPAAPPVAKPPVTEPARLIAKINDRRAAQGCTPLRVDPKLTSAAQTHSTDMMRSDYTSLTAPSGTTLGDRVDAAGYKQMIGAMVAANRKTAEEMAALLNDSPAYTCATKSIGTSRADGGPCDYYWTVIYGRS
ncbi:sigma-70 family RNA polymerase sigma factor [Actinokineospora sp. NBRC 105648]|uniref:sigma-70 family RNA polymerase sigma factor n=1 Tax=Actinokineospora sp. NBRC 105648 TaxID=3032206 RepID=UPI00249FDB13|nr:sigma-70 family RNA polymerase sigma factor [Actinokineospora sp. NBRC 105648]GLZ41006.1 hypothetical protein Acsp05_46300 [Actinokineospora sp. NBRC 105648]